MFVIPSLGVLAVEVARLVVATTVSVASTCEIALEAESSARSISEVAKGVSNAVRDGHNGIRSVYPWFKSVGVVAAA